MKRLLTLIIVSISFSILNVNAQIEGFTAGHMSGGKEVYIRFYVQEIEAEFERPDFSISLDDGRSYQGLLKSFRDGFSPEKGIGPGLNVFVWEAEKDLPNTFVNPAYIKMGIKINTEDRIEFEYKDGEIPSVIVHKDVEAFRLIQFISGQSKSLYGSSSETLVNPGTYRDETLEGLIRQFDPNAWQPPGKEDEDSNPPHPKNKMGI